MWDPRPGRRVEITGEDFPAGRKPDDDKTTRWSVMTGIPSSQPKRLTRSEDRWIGGVAGGVANYFGVDPMLVRVLFVASMLLPGPQILIYVILWFVMPNSRV